MEIPTYEELVSRVLARIPEDIDKREGSLIQTAVGPVCAELAQGYIALAEALELAFADTSAGEYLDRLARQAGLGRREAAAAVCRGAFYGSGGAAMEIPAGMRFGCGGSFYRRGERLGPGVYQLICEETGEAGNRDAGELLPVDYLEGFGHGEITGLLQQGRETEDDEVLRQRLLRQVQAPAFGGNIADYREKVLGIEGVGAVKVQPAPYGGGTVGLTILGPGFRAADGELLEKVRTAADPEPGKGRGFAPIGHKVTVETAAEIPIDVEAALTLADGSDGAGLEPLIGEALEGYFSGLRRQWQDTSRLTVRMSQAVMAVLSVESVLDGELKFNGMGSNLLLAEKEIPILGQVVLRIAAGGESGV